jgi:hypothetical protein
MTTPRSSITGAAVSNAERDAYLGQVPSETTPGERRLLFNFFQEEWDGKGSAVEIGPFLGGTTRAIAWGMQRNPARIDGALLHTYDRFDCYYSAEKLRQTIEPMVRSGTFTPQQADDLCRGADFKRLFEAIHAAESYGPLVRLHDSPMPDLPEEIAASTALDNLKAEGELSAVFIDGCKSWASTQYAMAFLLPRTRVDSSIIFQDWGWYTCFWISSFTYALRDYLELEEYVDATYRFRLKRALTAEQVKSRFAPTAEAMGQKFFRDAASALFEQSRRRNDLRGELIAQLHHIGALATLDRRGSAAEILKKLDVRRYAAFAMMMRGAVQSPTYRPGGKQILWKDAA